MPPRLKPAAPAATPPRITLYEGDCLDSLHLVPEYDMLLADPPYCSGGFSLKAVSADPSKKYQQGGQKKKWPDFAGDGMSQRAFTSYSAHWMRIATKSLRLGGYVLVFIDWRNLPSMTDAFQMSGLNWRGIIAWDKGGGARAPHKGYFRHQVEYVVWGSKGPCKPLVDTGPFPGCYQVPVKKSDKFHLTGKPTALMQRLVSIVPAGATILDPFAGSSTTLVAAAQLGRNAVGFEITPHYFLESARRLREVCPGASIIPRDDSGPQV